MNLVLRLREREGGRKRKGGREEKRGGREEERGRREGRERGREGRKRGEGERGGREGRERGREGRKRGEGERGGREGREREREGRERGYGNFRDAAHTCSLAPVGGVPGMYPTLSEEERVWQMSEDNRRCLLMGPATNPHPGLREEKGKP